MASSLTGCYAAVRPIINATHRPIEFDALVGLLMSHEKNPSRIDSTSRVALNDPTEVLVAEGVCASVGVHLVASFTFRPRQTDKQSHKRSTTGRLRKQGVC